MLIKETNKSTSVFVSDTTVVLELHPQEVQLLKAMRENWRHGEITIMVRDGLPFRIKRVWENIDLTDKNSKGT